MIKNVTHLTNDQNKILSLFKQNFITQQNLSVYSNTQKYKLKFVNTKHIVANANTFADLSYLTNPYHTHDK